MGNVHKIKDYEKIAAGEVIERPAAIVKELLENSLDAGATRVEVHVEEAGTRSIKIIDDGTGMEPEDVIVAFERHTTSKIKDFDDVYNLSTLGFRGEALASIKAVARVEITTRTGSHELGRKVVFEGDQVLEDQQVACPVGTTVTVKKLFFNVPVRRKFLKNDAVEFSHISDIVTRYALACHEVSIKLFHDGHVVLDAPPSNGDLLNKIVAIYGRDHAASMIPVGQKAPDFSLQGYVASPDITRSARTYSTLLVNHRYVYSADFARAVENAYEARLMKGRFPFFVLFLDIKPSLIDVNIHPTKKEIKFSNEDELLVAIEDWVKAALDERTRRGSLATAATDLHDHLPAQALSPPTTLVGGDTRPDRKGRVARAKSFDDVLEDARDRVPERVLDMDADFSNELQKSGGIENDDLASETSMKGQVVLPAASPRNARLAGWKILDPVHAEHDNDTVDSGTFNVLPPLKLLSKGVQLGNTYLLFESAKGDLVIVDQHAASERVEYERISRKFKDTGTASQQMLIPKTLCLPPNLLALIDASRLALKRIGFEIVKDDKGGVPSYKVTRFPLVFHVNVDFHVIEDFLTAMLSMDSMDVEDDIIKLLACHTGIRAGDILDSREIWTLLAELDRCEDPHHCSHGRPTYIIKPASWFEKEFKRVV